jgi:hypothetical protein
MKLAFYAYFYGSTENKAFKIPDIPSEKYNCYYYTNNKTMLEKLKETKWIGVFDDKPSNDDLIESNMIGKYIKTCPHKFQELQEYDYVCFFDSKLTYVNVHLIEEFVNNKYDITQADKNGKIEDIKESIDSVSKSVCGTLNSHILVNLIIL